MNPHVLVLLALIYILGAVITYLCLKRERGYFSYLWANGFDIDPMAGAQIVFFFGTPLRRFLTTLLWPLVLSVYLGRLTPRK